MAPRLSHPPAWGGSAGPAAAGIPGGLAGSGCTTHWCSSLPRFMPRRVSAVAGEAALRRPARMSRAVRVPGIDLFLKQGIGLRA